MAMFIFFAACTSFAVYCILFAPYASTLSKWWLRKGYIYFVVSCITDMASTFYPVYYICLGWAGELNLFIQFFGPRIGFLNAIIILHILFLIGAYYIFKKQYIFWTNLIFIFTVMKFVATINNLGIFR